MVNYRHAVYYYTLQQLSLGFAGQDSLPALPSLTCRRTNVSLCNALGRDFSWRIPYLAARQRGLPVWLPVDGEVAKVNRLEKPERGITFYEQGNLAALAAAFSAKIHSMPPKHFSPSPKIEWTTEFERINALRTVARRPLRPSGIWPYGWIRRLNRTLAGEV